MKKGGYYGASGALAPGAMGYTTGTEVPVKGGRRRKSGKKTRRHRKHRGGGRFGAVGAEFRGQGENGLINVTGYSPKGAPGSSEHGGWNDGGAKSGDFSSFIRAD